MIRQFLGFIHLPVVAVFACTPASLRAQTDLRGEPTIYRLPLKIDGEYVPTGILLKVDTHEFTVQEDAYVRTLQTRGSPEGGLSALFRAVANDDFDAFLGVIDPAFRDQAADNFSLYRRSLAGSVSIKRRFDVGAVGYFMLATNDERFLDVPAILIHKEGEWYQSLGSIGHPILQCLNIATRAKRVNGGAFDGNLDVQDYSTLVLPPQFDAREKENPLSILVVLERMRVPIAGARSLAFLSPPVRNAVEAYRDSCDALAHKDRERFVNSFAGKSCKRAAQHWDHLTASDSLQKHSRRFTKNRELIGAIHHEGMTILLHELSGVRSPDVSIGYDYVYQPRGGPAKRVNYHVVGPLDQLLLDGDVRAGLAKALARDS